MMCMVLPAKKLSAACADEAAMARAANRTNVESTSFRVIISSSVVPVNGILETTVPGPYTTGTPLRLKRIMKVMSGRITAVLGLGVPAATATGIRRGNRWSRGACTSSSWRSGWGGASSTNNGGSISNDVRKGDNLRTANHTVAGDQRHTVYDAGGCNDLVRGIASEIKPGRGSGNVEVDGPHVQTVENPDRLTVVEVHIKPAQLNELCQLPQHDG